MAERNIRVLNLGAGHGSAPIVGLNVEGEIDYDVAIFADTCDEPAWVYRQVDWLDRNGKTPIVRVSAGNMTEDLLRDVANKPQDPFAVIPAFVEMDGRAAMTRRQCTREYKIAPVEQFIRREILGLAKGQRIPKGTFVTQLFGFSIDEAHRAARLRQSESSVWRFEFPLLRDDLLMTKVACRNYMAKWCEEFPWMWSSCRSCPFHSDRQWRELQAQSPDDFEAACQTDESLRVPGNVVNRGMDNPMFLHRSLKPLREVDFTKEQPELFDVICDGGCLT